VLVASADVHDVRDPLSALNPDAFAGGVMVDEIASENEALQVLMFMRDDLSAAPCTSSAGASTGLTTLRLLGMDALFCDACRDTTSLKATDLLRRVLSSANWVPVGSSERYIATNCITSDALELSSSLLCCLIADARTSSYVLNLLHLTRYQSAIGHLRDPQDLPSTLSDTARCARLHALGYSLSQMAFGLSARVHRRCAEVSSAEAPTRHHQYLPLVESLGRCDAFPLADLLLPSAEKVGCASGTELGFEGRRGQGAAPWDAQQAPSRLADALRDVRNLLLDTSSKIVTASTRIEELMPSSKAASLPMIIEPRGDANLELVDVRTLRHELRSVPATTTTSKDTSAATDGGSVSTELVDCARALNSAKKLTHAALHVLGACRKLVVLLCHPMRISRHKNRLSLLLEEILPLLAPTPKPTWPMCNAALAPVLAKSSLLLLHSVRDYLTHSQLNILLTSCLTALLPPAVLPSAARTALYLVLLSLLTPHKGSHGTPVSDMVASVVFKNGLALVNLLVFDASEDSPAGQASAIALLGMILSFQPSWTMELLLSGAVGRLAVPLAIQSPLSAPWLSALKPTHFYESLVALLTQTVTFLVAQSACVGRGREQNAQALLTSDVLEHLSTAAVLDVTPEGAGADRPSSASREHLHDRLMLPTLRLISAACVVDRSNAAIVSLLTSFLLRSNERVSSMLRLCLDGLSNERVLPIPSRHLKRRRGELASGVSRLTLSDNLLACELLSHQVLMLLRLARSTRSDGKDITRGKYFVDRYVIGVVHAIDSLADMLPRVSTSHVARFSEVVFEAVAKRSHAWRMMDQSVQQDGMMGADVDRPLDSKLVAADTIVHMVCVHGRRHDDARVDEAVWKDLAHVVSDIDTMAAEIATVRALSKAMALIAQESTSSKSLDASAQPTLCPTASPVPNRITALVAWTVEFLVAVERARDTCAEMRLAAASSTMRDYEVVAVELLEHALVVLGCTLKVAHETRTASGPKLRTDRVPVLGSNDPGPTIVTVLQQAEAYAMRLTLPRERERDSLQLLSRHCLNWAKEEAGGN